ncbi:tyrosine-type recombinase/integrase [Fodinicurvata sp. EGI_FJ10296]|uniref:tyrosine-type recombinase/integrase n=1 Tax=Fodinicurvata sp. EGI_FJ10296 TaxID=3231908 RepID=UPI00345347DD
MNIHIDASPAAIAAGCRTWPEHQQAAWIAAHDVRNEFDDLLSDGAGRSWKPVTRYTVARVYTRLLAIADAEDLSPELSPATVRALIGDAQMRGCRLSTIVGYVWALFRVGRVIAPDDDFSWLAAAGRRLQTEAERHTPRKSATLKQVSAEEVWALGIGTMTDCLSAPQPHTVWSWRCVQTYRDGLYLALGIVVPERRRALAALRCPAIDLEAAMVRFAAVDRKTATAADYPLPPALLPFLSTWIHDILPAHGAQDDTFWIGKRGRPAGAPALYAAMRKMTAQKLSVSLSPHRLRDLAATFAVERIPEIPIAAQSVLDHRSADMTRRYQRTASQILAGRRYQAAID